jgi:hypothetical protein
MNTTYIIIVTVQMEKDGPFVSEVPTVGDSPPIDPAKANPKGSAGGGTPLLNWMLQNGWSLQSIQQLGQPGASDTVVNMFLLVKNS